MVEVRLLPNSVTTTGGPDLPGQWVNRSTTEWSIRREGTVGVPNVFTEDSDVITDSYRISGYLLTGIIWPVNSGWSVERPTWVLIHFFRTDQECS